MCEHDHQDSVYSLFVQLLAVHTHVLSCWISILRSDEPQIRTRKLGMAKSATWRATLQENTEIRGTQGVRVQSHNQLDPMIQTRNQRSLACRHFLEMCPSPSSCGVPLPDGVKEPLHLQLSNLLSRAFCSEHFSGHAMSCGETVTWAVGEKEVRKVKAR